MDFLNTLTKERSRDLEELNNKLLNKNVSIKNVIFVYCPTKVGSTTLVSSIRLSACKKFNVVHVHDETLFSLLLNRDVRNISVKDVILYNNAIGKNIYVIDIYRSPIERKMSEFFEQISKLHFNVPEKKIINYSLKKLIFRFNNLFPFLGNSDYYKEVYEIEQTEEHFNFEKKYLMQNINGVKYIKLRLKDSHNWGHILSNILNTPIIVINDYKTENKPTGELYKKFKSSYKIPENFLEDIKNRKDFKYYYNDGEREEYTNFWETKKTENFVPYTYDEYMFYNRLCLENKSQNEIQFEHYIDLGCLCVACCLKRSELLKKVMRGETFHEKILHEKSVDEMKKMIAEKNAISKTKTKNKMNVVLETGDDRIKFLIENENKKISNHLITKPTGSIKSRMTSVFNSLN